ncbi:hypothetical protein P2G88_05350 [Aliiglaciecola sp. CAU 1673]|uniref:hypothetical protein n=1 Tax=Aliiglaciecola sp. CAU 1673 TaxID=3032595 RepID=UPI0023DBE2D6|nr:hypothetical protein [Aliiglaciecola sp. CAU 1673]MDF2177671.1 hypothetical protein [Aliiglaciecola sp. CAU 1673]
MAHVSPQLSPLHQPALMELSIYQKSQLRSLMKSFAHRRKWVYLLADTLRFSRPENNSIGIQKPKAEQTLNWLERLMTPGTSCAILVEDMNLDDVGRKRVEQLCHTHGVTVINLKKHKALDNNLVYGPW